MKNCPLTANRFGTPSECEIEKCAFADDFRYIAKGSAVITQKRCLIAEALKKYILEE